MPDPNLRGGRPPQALPAGPPRHPGLQGWPQLTPPAAPPPSSLQVRAGTPRSGATESPSPERRSSLSSLAPTVVFPRSNCRLASLQLPPSFAPTTVFPSSNCRFPFLAPTLSPLAPTSRLLVLRAGGADRLGGLRSTDSSLHRGSGQTAGLTSLTSLTSHDFPHLPLVHFITVNVLLYYSLKLFQKAPFSI